MAIENPVGVMSGQSVIVVSGVVVRQFGQCILCTPLVMYPSIKITTEPKCMQNIK